MSSSVLIAEHLLDHIDLAVFDKDGTLIDVHTYWAGMIELRSDIVQERLGLTERHKDGLMGSMGVNTDLMSIKPEGPVGLKKREIVMQAGCDYLLNNGFKKANQSMAEAFELADQISLDRLDLLIRPLPGMRSVLEMLRTAGCRTAVATTDLTPRARLAFEHLGVLSFFDFIAGADMVSRPKPAGDIVHLVCRELDVSPDHTIMVGDAPSDILCGQNAGCRASIGVSTGLTAEAALRRLTPYIIPSLESFSII